MTTITPITIGAAAMKPDPNPATPAFDYIAEPDAIYRASFAAIERAVDLTHLPAASRPLAARLVHACGLPEIVDRLVISDDAVAAGEGALASGARVLVDAEMVAHGIIRDRLSAGNAVTCTLNAPGVSDRARALGQTRSATAVDLWPDLLAGAVVAIGNAPTALFRLLELLQGGAPRPAVILGFPVGFIGAAEAKDALVTNAGDVPFATLTGQFGGSALAAAAVNALATPPSPAGRS